ncbi:MAG: ornithine carbamoyltransferase [Cardiobacteriaceae bacterium]|nr:ornithine carbamoyltransferase [Cardiobacteriaceae bacterium]
MNYWYQKSLLRLSDHPQEEVLNLLLLATRLKAEKKKGIEDPLLFGKNIALIFEKSSTRTRCAFEVAAADQGAHCTFLTAQDTHFGSKESLQDSAQVLGRMYDAIGYRGFEQNHLATIAKEAGVPVYNALTDLDHPTQMLADLLTMREHSDKPLNELSFAYLGDARFNMGNSLLLMGALMGIDVRIAAPRQYQPHQQIVTHASTLAQKSGARLTITEDPLQAVRGVDFVHTDVWLSMGEDEDVWNERIEHLMPYRVTPELMKLAGEQTKFMHCLPSYHDRKTKAGNAFFEQKKLVGIEVAHNVFTSPNSVVFDQAENRMHTIKALLVATLTKEAL